MSVVVVAQFLLRQGLENTLTTLDDGEFGFTTDSGRVFIGNGGNLIEVLTEISSETRALLNGFVGATDENSYYASVTLPTSTSMSNIEYQATNSLALLLSIPGATVNTKFDYLMWNASGPMRVGTVRAVSDGMDFATTDDFTTLSAASYGAPELAISQRQGNDIDGYYYILQSANAPASTSMLIRYSDPFLLCVPPVVT